MDMDIDLASTPEAKERKRESGEEEESRRLEERSQKLKSETERLETIESGVGSAEGNCDCLVVSRNGGATERRSDAYRGSPTCLSFVPNHRYNPNVRFLGTFKDSLPVDSDDPTWYVKLVTPVDHMTTRIPSSPALPLFSLIRLPAPRAVVNGVPVIGRNEIFGISYSLPINPPHSLLIRSIHHPFPTFPQPMTEESLIGSCNGLLCLRSTLPDARDDLFLPCAKVISVIVWNPYTGLSRQLPPCHQPPFDVHDGLVFGFGYDQSTDDYKVVKIDPSTRLVEVFSLYSNSNSNSWRSVQGLPQDIRYVQRHFSNGAVSFAGCLNWLVSSGVASFNLETERFRVLPLPPTHCLERLSLSSLDGCLSFVSLYDLSRHHVLRHRVCKVLDVWIMRDYNNDSSWTNAASIVFPHYVSFPFRILYLSKDVLILTMQRSRPYVFNLKENSLVCPHICGAPGFYDGFELYLESKVSPNRWLLNEG